MRIQRARDLATEVEVDAGADAVDLHQGCVFLHLLGRVVVFVFLVPFVFRLAGGGGVGVELVGVVVDIKRDLAGGRGRKFEPGELTLSRLGQVGGVPVRGGVVREG